MQLCPLCIMKRLDLEKFSGYGGYHSECEGCGSKTFIVNGLVMDSCGINWCGLSDEDKVRVEELIKA